MENITQEIVNKLLQYNPKTGIFTWLLPRPKVVTGSIAGTLTPKNYIYIKVLGRKYAAHRLAWIYMYGPIPEGMRIDHINGIRTDNRIINLRVIKPEINNQNQHYAQKHNKLGLLGVCVKGNKYEAQINVNNNKKYLGLFATPEEAHEAYLKAKREFHEGCTI